MCRSGGRGSPFVSARSTSCRCGRRSSTSELAEAIKDLLEQPGGARLFRYRRNGESCTLTGAVLNEYIREYMGDEFTAKDFRTWGGTLTAAIALAEHGIAETDAEAKRVVANVMRTSRRAAR